ncbi:MAG TPA: NAD+ synthase [Gemmatimonadales bacterium]|nr:NAD+ synthase [Gemmatimonadales bacterium]
MLTIAVAQFRPRKGAYEDNLCRFGALIREAAGWPTPPGLILGPEAALTGYFLEGGVRELAVPAEKLFDDLARVHRDAGGAPVDVALGFYEVHRNRLYNSALYAALGGGDAGIRHVHRKIFLPTYGVFDEERFVEAGRAIEAFETSWGRGALIVCEDAWHSIVPTIGALDGAQVILIPSASPARGIQPADGGRPASALRWERLVQAIAEEHGVYVALAQLVGFEGGKGFIGGSLVGAPRGDLIVRGPLFDEALIPAWIDFAEITRARADTPLLGDLEAKLPHLMGSLHRARRGDGREPAGASRREPATPARRAPARSRPLPPLSDDPLAIDTQLTRQWLVEFIRDEVQRRRGFEKVVLGLSGGVDSAVVAYLAAEALGARNVLGVRMPYRTSSPESLEHAALVGTALGIPLRTVDISAAVDGLVYAIGEDVSPGRKGNMMARARMIVLFDLSAGHGALPIGTGNKSERLLGYFTWHADDSPPVNPIGDLFKSQVWALARHVGVPETIVAKPATADLVHGQTDEGDFGISYRKADAILHWLLLGYQPSEIEGRGFTAEEIDLVRKRLASTHWKRRLPTVAMVSPTAIGEFYLRPVDY